MGALTGAIKGISGTATTQRTPVRTPDRNSALVQEDRPSLGKEIGKILAGGRGPIRIRRPKPYMSLTGRR